VQQKIVFELEVCLQWVIQVVLVEMIVVGNEGVGKSHMVVVGVVVVVVVVVEQDNIVVGEDRDIVEGEVNYKDYKQKVKIEGMVGVDDVGMGDFLMRTVDEIVVKNRVKKLKDGIKEKNEIEG
jgi:hypothetical protein